MAITQHPNRFRDLPVFDLEGTTRNFEQLGGILQTVETKASLYINAKEFGAVGDGVANDTGSIQAAINAAGNFGSVFLPPGEYALTAALSIPFTAFSFRGSGNRSCTLTLKNSANSSVITTPDDKTQRFGLVLTDFAIEGNAANQAGSEPAILIRGMDESHIHRLYIKNPRGDAIKYGQATAGIENTVPMLSHLVLRGDETNSQGAGINLNSGSSDAQVVSCDIGFFKKGEGILVSGHSGFELIGCQVFQCLNGYKVFQGQRGRLVGCLSDFAQQWGFIFQNLTEEVTQVIGCQSRSGGQAGVNTYDGFIVEGTEAGKTCKNISFSACRAMGEKQRYGLNLNKRVKKVKIAGSCDFSENEKEAIHEGTEEVEEISGGPFKLLSGLTYKNSWEDFAAGRKGEYRKNSLGNVELRGTIKGGKSGEEAFTLPVGYRPTQALSPVVEDSGGVAGLLIEPTGVVKPTNITAGGEPKTFCHITTTFSTE